MSAEAAGDKFDCMECTYGNIAFDCGLGFVGEALASLTAYRVAGRAVGDGGVG